MKYYICLLIVASALSDGLSFSEDTANVSLSTGKPIGRIAIIPFFNYSGYPSADAIATDIYTSEIARSEMFEIINKNDISEFLLSLRIRKPEEFDSRIIDEISRKLKPDILLIGYVLHCNHKTILINARIIDTYLKETLWSDNLLVTHDELKSSTTTGMIRKSAALLIVRVTEKFSKYKKEAKDEKK